MTYRCFGDSITEATYLPDAQRWRTILGTQLGVSITNYAHGGDMVGDQANEVYAFNPVAGDVALVSLGVNDQRIYGVDTTKQAYYRDGMRAYLSWLALGTKTKAVSGGVTSGSSWTNTGLYGIGKRATTNGDSITFTCTGSVAYLALLLHDGACTYSLKKNGVLLADFDGSTPGCTTYNNYPYTERGHRITGLVAGDTITVTKTGGSYMYVQWFGDNNQTVKPRVFVGNIIRPKTYQWGGSLANIQSYNADLAQIVTDLRADGLDVTLVDLYSALDPETDIDPADNLHANAAGHAKIAAAFRSAIVWENLEHQFSPVTVLKRDDGLFFLDDGETLTQIVTQ